MYANTKTWQKTLATSSDNHVACRERLKNAYIGFRDRVGQLIQTIPGDAVGLTVHDLSHLDALWEMADILTGGNYDLNPAEAFVLGGAILLHDSAMTVAAYPGGIAEVKGTPEYSDALAVIGENIGKSVSNVGSAANPAVERLAIAETLRLRHAVKAEELASQEWVSPIDGASVYLIGDPELREHYSCAIGRIAHSHHWDISGVVRNLGMTLGAFSGFPSAWTVDQVKVAIILRCIDAMHIDDRRAPQLLAAIRDIGPESMEHWRFQNKLAVPHVEDGRLVYTSKSPFSVEQAGAWNLCFDTIQMIDHELHNANDLQLQKDLPPFLASSVAGAGSAKTFAQYVQASGWQPLPLKLDVSDVPKLARTLGGQDLYNEPLAPLRELIQNAADAIEVRSFVESDFSIEDGLITIRFSQSGTQTILEVEDNGIGMSERVITTALLDFGFSFWKSSAARQEFPGLQVKTDRLRGKYGIGFFSVFMWSGQVSVSSRRYNEGVDASRVLEFRQGLESRPLLRSAGAGEKSSKWSTRVRIVLEGKFPTSSHEVHRAGRDRWYGRRYVLNFRERLDEGESWLNRVRRLCGPLPIKVNFDSGSGIQPASLPTWRTCSPSEFLEFFGGVIFPRNPSSDRFVAALTLLSDPDPYGGRCFITPGFSENVDALGVYDKGIFVTTIGNSGVFGVVQSRVTNAARDRFAEIALGNDRAWWDSIRPKAFGLCRHIGEQLALQTILNSFDSPDANQPLFIRNRTFISLSELKRIISNEGEFHIRLQEVYGDAYSWKVAENLSVIVGLNIDERRVFPLIEFNGKLPKHGDVRAHISTGDAPLWQFLRDVVDILGPGASINSVQTEAEGYNNDYVDITIRAVPIG